MANGKRFIVGFVIIFTSLMVTGCAPALRGKFRQAIQSGDLDMVKVYLANNPKLVNAKEINPPTTALHMALHHGRYEVAKLLIEKGANVNAKDGFIGGYTPLFAAMTTVLDEGSDLEVARSLNEEVVELLLENGANPNNKYNGQTPLMHVSEFGNIRKAEILLANGADVNIKDRYGYSVLFALVASRNAEQEDLAERAEQIKLFTAYGIDVNEKYKHNRTPLWYAAFNGYDEIAEILIDNGADVNAKDDSGVTPLNIAIRFDRTEVAELLKKHGAVE